MLIFLISLNKRSLIIPEKEKSDSSFLLIHEMCSGAYLIYHLPICQTFFKKTPILTNSIYTINLSWKLLICIIPYFTFIFKGINLLINTIWNPQPVFRNINLKTNPFFLSGSKTVLWVWDPPIKQPCLDGQGQLGKQTLVKKASWQ